jgi:cytosine/adenosine deaminase-related metal-dependent hydrolase
MSGRTLIRGGTVLTLGARTQNFGEADVLIADGRVAEVGPGLRARDAEVVDASDAIVMPGFVDTHRHVWKSLFRNLGESAGEVHGLHYQPDDVYAATMIGLLGAVEAGITTVVDWADISIENAHIEAALQAHADAGLRTIFVHSAPPWAAPGEVDPSLRRLVSDRSSTGAAMTTIALGSDDQGGGADVDRVAGQWALARELGLRIHAHAGLRSLDAGIVSRLAERGLLASDVTLVHCARLDGADLDAIASSGASVVLTPSTEMAGDMGMPPLQGLLDRGIRPGLGVDDERVAPGDIFAQMRATNSLQHAAYFDLKLAGKAGLPNLLTTRDVIRYATLSGAEAVGLGAVTGSLEPGKLADVIVLRTDRPNIVPVNDPIGAVVWGMDTSNLDWVFAGGRPLMRNGVLEGDVTTARELAVQAQRRVSVNAGVLVESGLGSDA